MSEPQQIQGADRSQLVKLALDIGPLIVFFGVNAIYGIFAATGAFMVATAATVTVSRLWFGKIAAMPVVTGVFVLIFGGLTLYLQDETFIKVKPTIIYLLFAGLLFAGMAMGRLFLKSIMSEAFELTDTGWRRLTNRWIGFFVAMALLNELVWRTFSTDTWVSFKVFGLLPLTFLFAILQVGLLQKHAKNPESQ
ncbi:MAG: septation protein A [Hyphomicrobiales bacterium]|nr:septation protein A [Hyphomicrobiales bacterium]